MMNRRRFAAAGLLALLAPGSARAGNQREERLAADVRNAMRGSLDDAGEPKLIFSSAANGQKWLDEMAARLSKYIKNDREARRVLVAVQYEASRAGLDPQLVLGLIKVESRFNRYAVSSAGARGLMQVMPFWPVSLGQPEANLFEIGVNLRYGCVILRHYLNIENGDMVRALGRFNGSVRSYRYANAVFSAYRNEWLYDGPL